MKHALYIIPIAFLLFRCGQVKSANTDTIGQRISVETDTLDISNNGRLTEVALFEDRFYFLFQTSRKNTTAKFTSIKAYDLRGNFIENVFLPKEAVSMPYSDLRVNNQRLYLKEEHQLSEKTFLLEKYVADFYKIQDTAINIYEDHDFRIYPNCNGEWGASTYFQDKNDNKVYEFSSPCNFNFERTSQGYLQTNRNEILIIRNPTELYESKLTFDRSYLGKQNKGVDTLFKSKLDLYTTFKRDNKLMVVYGDSLTTHIGELQNGELKSVHKFKNPYRFSYWFKDNNTNSQILQMYTHKSRNEFDFLEGYKMLGLLLIKDGNLRMYYIK